MRIPPLTEPYEPEIAALLAAMMPPGVPPIALFRTFAHNPAMARAMEPWGRYELSRELSLTLRQREIVIDRVCARLGCEYEWGVHVAVFAGKAGLSRAQIESLTHGDPTDACWIDPIERALMAAVDQLCATATLDDDAWAALSSRFDGAQVLDLCMLSGWYHAIAFTARAGGVALEEGAPRFADYGGSNAAGTSRTATDREESMKRLTQRSRTP